VNVTISFCPNLKLEVGVHGLIVQLAVMPFDRLVVENVISEPYVSGATSITIAAALPCETAIIGLVVV
jgi:hypothetical protein